VLHPEDMVLERRRDVLQAVLLLCFLEEAGSVYRLKSDLDFQTGEAGPFEDGCLSPEITLSN
jgi:hypothetical protein